jgi:hypothetical protein
MPSEIADDSPGLSPISSSTVQRRRSSGTRRRSVRGSAIGWRCPITRSHMPSWSSAIRSSCTVILYPQFEGRPPTALGSTSVQVFMYVEDVDAAVKRAVEAGATRATKVADQFWGDRLGTITDPFGHVWVLATRTENLTPEEIMERARAAAARMGSD